MWKWFRATNIKFVAMHSWFSITQLLLFICRHEFIVDFWDFEDKSVRAGNLKKEQMSEKNGGNEYQNKDDERKKILNS